MPEKQEPGRPQGSPTPMLFVNFHGTLGGGQQHLLTILEGLDRSRFAPHVVCCHEGLFFDLLSQKGYSPILVPFGKGKLRYITVSIPAVLKMVRLIRTLGIRLIHVSGLQEAKLSAYAAAWTRVPMVWVVAP